VHNFPPHLSRVTTLPRIHWQPNRHAVFCWAGGSEKLVDDATNWELTSTAWYFKYWLLCLWHNFLTEHDVTNKITFSTVCAVHSLPLPWCLSTEPVSTFSSILQRLCLNSHQISETFNKTFIVHKFPKRSGNVLGSTESQPSRQIFGQSSIHVEILCHEEQGCLGVNAPIPMGQGIWRIMACHCHGTVRA